MSNEFWDKMYDVDEYRYGTEPNAFLEHRHTLLPQKGKILVLGDGEGRNGVFLAKKKFKVTTIDASEVAVAKAKKLAEKAGVEIDIRQGTLPDVDIEKGSFDGVVLTYLHVDPSIRPAVHRFAVEALRSGGVLLLEGFSKEQVNYESGGPSDEAMLFDDETLRADFENLYIEGISTLMTVLDEGPGHQGEAAVIRLIGSRD